MKLRTAIFIATLILMTSSASALDISMPSMFGNLSLPGILATPIGGIGAILLILAGIWWLATKFGSSSGWGGGGSIAGGLGKAGGWAAGKIGQGLKAMSDGTGVLMSRLGGNSKQRLGMERNQIQLHQQELAEESSIASSETQITGAIQKLIEYLSQIKSWLSDEAKRDANAIDHFKGMVRNARQALGQVVTAEEQNLAKLDKLRKELRQEASEEKTEGASLRSEESVDEQLKNITKTNDIQGLLKNLPQLAQAREELYAKLKQIKELEEAERQIMLTQENPELQREGNAVDAEEKRDGAEIKATEEVRQFLEPLEQGIFASSAEVINKIDSSIKRLIQLEEAIKKDEETVAVIERAGGNRANLDRTKSEYEAEAQTLYHGFMKLLLEFEAEAQNYAKNSQLTI